MSNVCLPKYFVCDTYSTGFVASSTPCVLIDTSERRARLQTGGTFFRSINLGVAQNNITVSCIWYGTTPPTNCNAADSSLTVVSANTDVTQVELIVTDGTTTETYYACQSYDSGTLTWTSAIPDLRTQVNAASALITMPTTDGISGYNATTAELAGTSHIASFIATNLAGGSPGGPTTAMRTGPVFTLTHFSSTEDSGGNAVSENIVKYWDGSTWNLLSGYTCYDPNNLAPGCCTNPSC